MLPVINIQVPTATPATARLPFASVILNVMFAIGAVQISALTHVVNLLNEALAELESKTVRLSDDLQKRLESAKLRQTTTKKPKFTDRFGSPAKEN